MVKCIHLKTQIQNICTPSSKGGKKWHEHCRGWVVFKKSRTGWFSKNFTAIGALKADPVFLWHFYRTPMQNNKLKYCVYTFDHPARCCYGTIYWWNRIYEKLSQRPKQSLTKRSKPYSHSKNHFCELKPEHCVLARNSNWGQSCSCT